MKMSIYHFYESYKGLKGKLPQPLLGAVIISIFSFFIFFYTSTGRVVVEGWLLVPKIARIFRCCDR